MAYAEPLSDTKYVELSSQDIKTLVIQSGAGSLSIRGIDGIDRIRVSAEIELESDEKKNFQKFMRIPTKSSLSKR